MKHLFLPILLFAACTLFAQDEAERNLVINGDFEQYKDLPSSWLLDFDELNKFVSAWHSPTQGSTDYFNLDVPEQNYANPMSSNPEIFGNQVPKSGNACSAIQTLGKGCGYKPNYREYLRTELLEPLTPGKTYIFEVAVSLADKSTYATNQIGFAISKTDVTSPACNVLEIKPTHVFQEIVKETEDWVVLKTEFTVAEEGSFLTIGSFATDENTQQVQVNEIPDNVSPEYGFKGTRYFVDDVSITIKSEEEPIAIIEPVDQDPTINIVPDQVLEQLGNSDGGSDSQGNLIASMAPNPFNGFAMLYIDAPELESYTLQLFDANGSLVREYRNETTDRLRINQGSMQAGFYFYRILDNRNQFLTVGRFIVSE